MSDIKIQPSATGSGTVTITAPTTNTARVITLPDSAGTLLDENSSVPSANLTGTVVDARISALTASKLTGDLPAISGVNVTNVHAVNSGRKNMIINGAMNVAQRATSVTGHTSSGYVTLDRYTSFLSNLGTWTVSKDTDSPEEFSSSWKFACTTAVTSIASGSYLTAGQKFEGQDLQHLKWGTSNAQSVTLSFWVKSSKTGTYMCELFQDDGSVKNSMTYTVNSANTWEKKELTFVGNTGTAIANDVTSGLRVYWVLAAGSDRTSGTHSNNTWHTTLANRYPGIVNLADSTSNTFYVTGAQLEVGSVATDFEHRSFGEELALCKRYFESSYPHGTVVGVTSFITGYLTRAVSGNTNSEIGGPSYTVEKRAIPTVVIYHAVNGATNRVYKVSDASSQTITGLAQHNVHGGGYLQLSSGADNSYKYHFSADAEL